MSNVAVVGAQWGDEGKGKIVDWLSERSDVVVRFQGGHNAGHTLVVDGVTYKLSLLPSGVVHGNKLSVIGNGVVIDPWALVNEMNTLKNQGITINNNDLKIADNACLILPVHSFLDKARENAAQNRIGTTGRGIGPAYEDKVGRRAIRVGDLAEPEYLFERLENLLEHHNPLLRGLGEETWDVNYLYNILMEVSELILPYADNVWKTLETCRKENKKIMFEGAQGAMLDIDHGTYPFVTSSNTLAGQAVMGSGFGGKLDFTLGLLKSYTTRVGSGPFPTELFDDVGEEIGKRGNEFGTVTGRSRRCGWFDAVLARQAVCVGCVDGIALTKLDVLDGFEKLKICVGYQVDGKVIDYLPASTNKQNNVIPIYETFDGWSENTSGIRNVDNLPTNALIYIRRIEELIGVSVAILSTSPERKDTILLTDPFG